MSEIMPLEKVIEIGVQVGVRTALETMEKEGRRRERADMIEDFGIQSCFLEIIGA